MAKVLHGDVSANQLNASADKTQVYGLKGNDTLVSDGKSDVLLVGGGGDDSLIVMGGQATLSGGDGSDVFEFNYSADKKISAVIEDLQPSQDKIVVNFDGDTQPQLTSIRSGNDVVWNDSGGLFKVTLKSVRDNDYFDDEASDEVWEVFELTNAEREDKNLSPLTMSQGLTAAASIRAKEITSQGNQGLLVNHKRPDGTNFSTVFKEVGKSYSNVNENLDGGAATPEDVINDWITSKKGHREILLGAAFKKIGVGYNEDDPDPTNLRFYWTQEFGSSLTADSLGNPETITAANLLRANIETNLTSKFIAGDDQPNTIQNGDYGMTIDALGGDDIITNAGLNVSISGGADSDLIINSGSFSSVNAGTGDDLISLSSDAKENVIEYTAGDGSDTIVGFNETDKIKISDIEFTPEIIGNDIILTVGDDSITFLDLAKEEWAYKIGINIDGYWSGLVKLNDGNHEFYNDIAGVTIQALSGNNTISNQNSSNVLIVSGAGNDSIYNSESDSVTIDTGAGNDSIDNSLSDSVAIDSGDGSDRISNQNGARVSINAGSNNDSIGNYYGTQVTVVAGTGNDSIINWDNGMGSTLLGDAGNDYISNFSASISIDGGTGNDDIYNYRADVTLDAGDDNDYIYNEGDRVSIYGGNDKDTIISAGQLVTINSGTGNDRIELSTDAQNNVIEYNEGDGIDEVWGFNATDRLIIGGGSGTYYPETLNGHIYINVGTGYVALADAEGLFSAADVVEGVPGEPIEEPYTIYLSESETDYTNTLDNVIIQVLEDDYSNHSIANSGSLVTIIPGESDNTISNSGDDVNIYGETEGSNIISNTGDNVAINGNDGSDFITNEGNNVQIDNSTGFWPDTVDNSGNNVLILGSDTDDNIFNSGDNVYIMGCMGDDTIELSGDAQNNTIAYQQSDSHDTVRGFNETDNLLVYVVSSYSIQTVDNNIVVDVNDGYGSVTLEDAATLEHANIIVTRLNGNSITYHVNAGIVTFEGAGVMEGNNIVFGEGDDSYYNTAANMFLQALGGNDTIINSADNVTIDLGADKDYVNSQGDNVSIAGGDGDDTLVGVVADGEFNATIDGGDGNDEIRNFIYNSSLSGGAGDDTIENFGNVVTIRGGDGNDSIKSGDVYIEDYYGSNSLIDLGEGDNILSNYSDNVTITGGSGNNDIRNYGDSVKITTGDGNDYIGNAGTNISIDSGAGNDYIYNIQTESVSIVSGDGDDTVSTNGSNVSIVGGTGNDRITLGSGTENNLIQYNVGDGDDTIWGLTKDNAQLQLGDGHVKYSTVASGDDILVKVGDNTITLKNFREKPDHIILGESASSGGTSTSSNSGNNSAGGTGGNGGNSGSSGTGGTSVAGTSTGSSSNNGSSGTSGTSSGQNDSSRRRNSSSTSGSSITDPITIPENLSTTSNRQSSSTNSNPFNTSVTTTQGTYSGTKMSPIERTYTGGNRIIEHYGSWRKITFEGEYQGSHFDGAGNFVVESSSGYLVFENATDKVINLKDAAGNDFIKAHMSSTAGTVDGRIYSGYQILNGSLGEDLILAGADGSQLWGNADNVSDTLVGGDGSDIFISGKNEGSDTFQNASSADVINLNDTTLSDIVSTNTRDGALVLSFNTGNSLTVQSTEALSANIIFSDGTNRRFNHATNSWQTE